MTLPPVLDVDTAAQLLRCEPSTVRERLRQGDLPGVKLGTDWVLPAGALLQRLDELALEESARRRAPPPAPQAVFCECGDEIVPDDGARCGACVATKAPPPPVVPQPLTEREVELIDGMIEVQLHHAAQCDLMLARAGGNHTMAVRQKGWDMERVELLRKIRSMGVQR